MGLDNHYNSISLNDESFPLSEKGKPKAGWGKQSICLSLVTGAFFLTIIVAIISMISSSLVSHGSSDNALSSSTVSADAIVASTTSAPEPTTTPIVEDESLKSTEDTPSQQGEILNCGYNAEEARAKGCVFDVMMQLWTPAPCFDEVLSNRFLEIGNWTWYADSSASHVFTLEEMRKGEHDAVYVAQSYHITHCVYAWEKLVRAMRNQDPLITELISYDHVIHCRHKTLLRTDDHAIRGVRAPTAYTECAPYDTWKNHLPANEHSSTE